MTTIYVHGLGQGAKAWDGFAGVAPELFQLLNGEALTYASLYRVFSAYCHKKSGKLNLCGLSLGGILALNFAMDYPEKVHRLVLVGTQYKIPKGLFRFQNMIFRFLPSLAFKGMGLSKRDVLSLTKSMEDLDLSGRLQEVACPTLVLVGSKDKPNLNASKSLATLIDGAVLTIVEGAGHEVNTDAPEELKRLVRKFFEEVES